MNTHWISEVMRDLVQFAQMNQMPRLAQDLETAIAGLREEEALRAAASKERTEVEASVAGPDRNRAQQS